MLNESLSDSKNNSLSQTRLLLNQTVVSPIDVDASLTKTSRKRYALNNHISREQQDLGQFNTSKLSHLYQSTYEKEQNGEIICLAYIDRQKNNQLTITNEAIDLFRKYEKNAITFVGNFGKKGSGKSFWYDKILNLSEVDGSQFNQYSKVQDNNPGLYLWSIPFIKNNLRIFLIDFSNAKMGDNLSGEDEKMLDLELILAQAMVLLPEPEDIKQRFSDVAYTNFKSSMSRLSDHGSKANKQTPYWPHSLYNLYRSTKTVSPQTDNLSYLFDDYNYCIISNAVKSSLKQKVSQASLLQSSMLKDSSSYKVLDANYVKRTSLVFKDIYSKLNGKKYEGLAYTGDLLPYILRNSVNNLNSSKSVKMDKMFYNIKKDIYENKLEQGKFVYSLNYDTLKSNESASLKEKKLLKPQTLNDKLKSSAAPEKISNLTDSKNDQKTLNVDNPENQGIRPKPRNLDDVLAVFRNTNQNVLTHYNLTKYDPNLHEQYEKKLLDYGEVKEKEVLNYNQRETQASLLLSLPHFQALKDIADQKIEQQIGDSNSAPNDKKTLQRQKILRDSAAIIGFVGLLKNHEVHMNHSRAQPVADRLKQVGTYAKKNRFFHVWQTQQYYNQRKLQMNLEDKKKQLDDLKYRKTAIVALNTSSSNKAQDLKDVHNKSAEKISKLKDELQVSKRKNNNQIPDDQYLKTLQSHKQKLDKALKQNQRKLKQLNSNKIIDPRVDNLQQKLDDKKTIQLQIEAGLVNLSQSKIQGNRLNNTSSILSSKRGQVRHINKEQFGIRKSYLNKSMTK